MKTKTAHLSLLMTLFGLGGCTSLSVQSDVGPSAVLSDDLTALIELVGPGCETNPRIGYSFCRKTEGDSAQDELRFQVPPARCLKEDPITHVAQTSCVTLHIYYPDGSLTRKIAIPRDQTEFKLKWVDLLKKDRFEIGSRGFWGVSEEIKWVGKDGKEYSTLVQGEIRLRVIRRRVCDPKICKEYEPLCSLDSTPYIAWNWFTPTHQFQMTTAGRSYVEAR